MQRFILTVIAFVGALAVSPVAADDVRPDAAKALADATQAFRNGDCNKAISLVSPVIAAPAGANGQQLSLAYDVVIDCAWQAKDVAKAVDYAKREVALPTSSDYAWRVLMVADFNAGRYSAALDTVERILAAGRQGTLNSFDPDLLLQLHFRLERSGDSANDTRLLAILANPAYEPTDIVAKINSAGDYIRAMYARKLILVGKQDEARALIVNLQGYNAMMEVAFDPALLALHGKPVDFRGVVESDLTRHRAMVDRFPKSLAAVNAVASDLNRLGRYDEAIVLLKATLPRAATSGTFDDDQARLPWTWDALADAYGATGKYDAMVDANTQGVKAQGDERPNVSQTINLAGRQYGFGRTTEALATLEQLGPKPDLSPFGAMQVLEIRGCANAVLGNLDKARAVLGDAIAHERDDPPVVTSLYLCVGDEDGAAASLVRRLADPESRRAAMLSVADYDDSDPRAPPSPFIEASKRIIERPEVAKAIRAAGGRVRIHLPQ